MHTNSQTNNVTFHVYHTSTTRNKQNIQTVQVHILYY